MKILSFLFSLLILASATPFARAGSATWNATPTSVHWSFPSNWTPATVPATTADTATFNSSTITSLDQVFLSVGNIVFNPGASAYTLTPFTPAEFTMSGAGVINNSGVAQKFILPAVPPFQGYEEADNYFALAGSATAGSMTEYTVVGSSDADGKTIRGGLINFTENSTAETANFTISAGGGYPPDNRGLGGAVGFADNGTASNATFTTQGGTVVTGYPASVFFHGSSTAASGTFTNDGGIASGGVGGRLTFYDQSNAGSAVIMNNGAPVSGGLGGLTVFTNSATVAGATLIANGGVGQGGQISFLFDATGGTARMKLFGNGALDLSQVTAGITTGSIEGDGQVFLGAHNLIVGNKGLSTVFSGVIQDGGAAGGVGGSLTKTGKSVFTLSGSSTYTGGTRVLLGALVVSNKTGSATGTGAVQIDGGTLGGGGIILGTVTVGSGFGTGAFIAPAAGTNKQAGLTIRSALTIKSDASYTYTFKAKANKASADKVTANGVTINGAGLGLIGQQQGILTPGLTLTVISNTSATPISGTFGNVPDGAVLTIAGGAKFLANYEGGDGNDLTLTVVP